jgi:hypothetical protein
MNPAEAAVDFLCGLPDTIRNDILVFVLLFAADLQPGKEIDFRDEIKTRLGETAGLRHFALVLRLVGATDYVLQRQLTVTRINVARLPQIAQTFLGDERLSKHFEQMKLGEPLKRRHVEAAYHSWQALRASSLSNQNLMDFEHSLLS